MKTKILIFLLVVGVTTSLVMNLFIYKKKEGKGQNLSEGISMISQATKTKVLQVDISGGIFFVSSQPGGLKQLIAQIDNAAQDKEIKGLFIRANSPGGSIAASQELYEAIKRFQETGKPIVTSVMDLCASGCYYAVLPSSLVIANRGSIIGSIGVIISTLNLEELYKKIGVKRDSIISVEYKDILSPARKMRPEERSHLKQMVAKMHQDFVTDVIHWREKNSSAAVLRDTANGLVYTSDLAMKRGLIDKIGDQRFAQEEMANVLGLTREEIHFVRPAYKYWEDLIGMQIMMGLERGLKGLLPSLFSDWKDEGIPQLKY